MWIIPNVVLPVPYLVISGQRTPPLTNTPEPKHWHLEISLSAPKCKNHRGTSRICTHVKGASWKSCEIRSQGLGHYSKTTLLLYQTATLRTSGSRGLWMQRMTGPAKWQKQAWVIIISREKTEKENSKYPSSISLNSVLSFEIARVGVDKQKVWLKNWRRLLWEGEALSRNPPQVQSYTEIWLWIESVAAPRRTGRCSGPASFSVHQHKLLTCHKPGKPHFLSFLFLSESWGDSSLCNQKFSTQHRGRTFSPPLLDSALGAKQAEPAPEEKCCFLRPWVMWSYVCITLTQTLTQTRRQTCTSEFVRAQRPDNSRTHHRQSGVQKMSLARLCKYCFSRTRRPTCAHMLNAYARKYVQPKSLTATCYGNVQDVCLAGQAASIATSTRPLSGGGEGRVKQCCRVLSSHPAATSSAQRSITLPSSVKHG